MVGILIFCMFFCVNTAFADLFDASSGITDETGDVGHSSWSGQTNNPNIDITYVSYSTDATSTGYATKLGLRMTVAGTIESSDKIVYSMFFNSTDTIFHASWTNGTGSGYAVWIDDNEIQSRTQNITVSNNTLTAIFNLTMDVDIIAMADLGGSAIKYTVFNDTSAEWWGDLSPPGHGTTVTKKTPGFELLLVMIAIVTAMVVLRRRC